MADINTELKNIQNSIYGKDVRQSIYDGIDAINEETENTTTRQKNLENTFNAEIANKTLSDPSNEEVVAARTDNVNNKTYDTLGKRLDEDSEQLAEKANQTDLNAANSNIIDLQNSKMDKNTTDIGINQINKNKGLIDQTFLADSLKQQIAGTAPINAVPADNSITTSKLVNEAITKSKLGQDVDYFHNPLGGYSLYTLDEWEEYMRKNKDLENVTIQTNFPSELNIGDYSFKCTFNTENNYVWLGNLLNLFNNYTCKYTKLSIALYYKYNGISDVPIYFTLNGTTYKSNQLLRGDGTEHSEIFEFDIPKVNNTTTAYIYILNGINNIEICGGSIWLGSANDNPKLQLDINNVTRKCKEKILFTEDDMTENNGNYGGWISQLLDNDSILLSRGKKVLKCVKAAGNDQNFSWISPVINNTKEISLLLDEQINIALSYKTNTNANIDLICANKVRLNNDSVAAIEEKFNLICDGKEHFVILSTKKLIDENPEIKYRDLFYWYVRSNDENASEIYISSITMWTGSTVQIPGGLNELTKQKLNLVPQRMDLVENELNKLYRLRNKPLRIALTGSSITWGNGLLDDSFVGVVDDYLRNYMSKSILSSDMTITGISNDINNEKLYTGTAKKIIGVNGSVEFDMNSNALSLVQAIEKTNENAAIIDLYVDGNLYDSFSNYNENENGHIVKTFTGDGVTRKFDLGRAFTYNHVVKIGDAIKIGVINTGGYGATFASGQDYMIIRKYGTNAVTGEIEVHHWLYFKAAPSSGSNISCEFDYGESIEYMKGSIGEIGLALSDSCESTYGDGDVSYDTTHPSELSSGLDFRYTNEKAIKTWNFDEIKLRHFKFVIRGLDSRADKTGTPYFIINFATNCMHRIMNAGIGGWTAALLRDDNGLRNIDYLMRFNPDIVLFETGTNDDWNRAKFVCSKTLTGVSEADMSIMPAIFMTNIAYNSSDKTYTIKNSELTISNAGWRSISIDPANVDFGDIKQGDILVIGNYHGDEREVQFRIIDTWDSANHKATFKKSLEMIPEFDIKVPVDLIGRTVRIKRIDDFITDANDCINAMKNNNPNIAIGMLDTGLSNYYLRALLGYSEKISEFCKNNNIAHINSYEYLKRWQYSQKRNAAAYIGNNSSITSTGASSYNLVSSTGLDIHSYLGSLLLRRWSVKVNGVEVYGRDCYVTGAGNAKLINSTGSAVSINSEKYGSIPTKLVFTKNIPAVGATIEIHCTNIKWSYDDCHPNTDGAKVYGLAIEDSLGKLINQMIE